MIAVVTWHAEMGRVSMDGPKPATLRELLEAASAKGVASAAEQLVPPPLPQELSYLWAWWLELDAARPRAEHALAAITYSELAAWARLTGTTPTPWEVSVLLQMDRTYRATISQPA